MVSAVTDCLKQTIGSLPHILWKAGSRPSIFPGVWMAKVTKPLRQEIFTCPTSLGPTHYSLLSYLSLWLLGRTYSYLLFLIPSLFQNGRSNAGKLILVWAYSGREEVKTRMDPKRISEGPGCVKECSVDPDLSREGVERLPTETSLSHHTAGARALMPREVRGWHQLLHQAKQTRDRSLKVKGSSFRVSERAYGIFCGGLLN